MSKLRGSGSGVPAPSHPAFPDAPVDSWVRIYPNGPAVKVERAEGNKRYCRTSDGQEEALDISQIKPLFPEQDLRVIKVGPSEAKEKVVNLPEDMGPAIVCSKIPANSQLDGCIDKFDVTITGLQMKVEQIADGDDAPVGWTQSLEIRIWQPQIMVVNVGSSENNTQSVTLPVEGLLCSNQPVTETEHKERFVASITGKILTVKRTDAETDEGWSQDLQMMVWHAPENAMKFGKDDCQVRYYCGCRKWYHEGPNKKLVKDPHALNGRCGPHNGPQCKECYLATYEDPDHPGKLEFAQKDIDVFFDKHRGPFEVKVLRRKGCRSKITCKFVVNSDSGFALRGTDFQVAAGTADEEDVLTFEPGVR